MIDTITKKYLPYVCGGEWICPTGMYAGGNVRKFFRYLVLSVKYALSYTSVTINLFVSFLVQVPGAK